MTEINKDYVALVVTENNYKECIRLILITNARVETKLTLDQTITPRLDVCNLPVLEGYMSADCLIHIRPIYIFVLKQCISIQRL